MARVSYVERDQMPEDKVWLYDALEKGRGTARNLHKAIAHNPSVLRGVMILGTALLEKSKLNPRLRELAILRVGQMANCRYEQAHHFIIGRQVGLTDAEMAALSDWRGSDLFGAQERAVLEYAEEVTRQIDVSDETFEKARQLLGEQEIVELTATVGYYNMVARFLVPMRIDVEAGVKPTL